MFTKHRRSWTLLVIATIFLTILSALPVGQPAQVRAAGRIPAGLGDYEIWFGSQHAHVGMDGDDGAAGSTAATAFNYARNLPFLKYYIIAPHVHAGRTVGDTTLYSDATYNTILGQADSATTAEFVAIAGQEVSTISSGGHWNLFNASAMVGTDHPDGDWNDGDDYYEHVAGLGAAGEEIAAQFNHTDTGNFGNRYDPAAAPYFGTFAVSSGYTGATNQNFSNNGSNLEYSTNNPLENLWAHYLNLGWKLSPSADQDNHKATWGASSSEYTVIVRSKGTPLDRANVLQGLRQHMTYATEDANMQIGFIANGWSMGQTIGGPPDVAFTIWWNNPSESICNNNLPVCVTEPANDVIKNILIYKNTFGTAGDSVGANAGNYVARYQPNTASGTWNVTLAASPGDWFVVKFQDTYTFATDPTYGRMVSKDLTWSAPVWYDPANADMQLTVGDPTAPPAAPTGLSATAASSSQVNLTWADSDSTELGFKVERCTGVDCNDFAEVGTASADITSYSDSGLTASTSYSYRVRAYNLNGDSDYSNSANVVTQAPPVAPIAPSNLATTPISSSQINLTWADNADNETSFKIERCTGAGCSDFVQIAIVSAGVVNHADMGLDASTSYSYRVRASNAVGDSDYSNEASATTQAPPTLPAAPTNLAATAVSKSQINLMWSDNSSDETGFKIERCAGLGCTNFAEVATVGENVTSYSNTGLAAATSYSYRVRASNAVGDSGYSNEASTVTQAAPAAPVAPSNLVASAVSKSQINLMWSDNSSDETGFRIERCKGSTCANFVLIATVSANTTNYSNTKLTANTTYRYRVYAYNVLGKSGYSNFVAATTLRR